MELTPGHTQRSEIGFEAVESEEAQARGVIGRGGGDADQIASVDDEGSDYYDDEAYEEAGPDVTRSGQVVDEPHWGKAVLSGLGFVPGTVVVAVLVHRPACSPGRQHPL